MTGAARRRATRFREEDPGSARTGRDGAAGARRRATRRESRPRPIRYRRKPRARDGEVRGSLPCRADAVIGPGRDVGAGEDAPAAGPSRKGHLRAWTPIRDTGLLGRREIFSTIRTNLTDHPHLFTFFPNIPVQNSSLQAAASGRGSGRGGGGYDSRGPPQYMMQGGRGPGMWQPGGEFQRELPLADACHFFCRF